MGDEAVVFALKAQKMAKDLAGLVGDSAQLPLAGTLIDNIKGSLSGGFSQIASSLPATISPSITAISAIVSIKGKTTAPTTIVSKTRQELDIVNIVPTIASVTKKDYGNGFTLTEIGRASCRERVL